MRLLLAFGLFLFATDAVTQVPNEGRISAQDFAAQPFFFSPQISPAGDKVIAKAIIEGKTSLLIADLNLPNQRPRQIKVPDDLDLSWAQWAGDARVILSFLVPGKYRQVDYVASRLLIYDVASGRFDALPNQGGGVDGDDIIHIDPDGRFFLLSLQKSIFDYPAIWRVDLHTLQMTEVVKAQDGVWTWYADPQGVVRAGLGTSERRWWLLYRSTEADRFRKVVKGTMSNKDDDDTNVDQLIPIAGKDEGYAIANRQTGRYAIYKYDFATDTIGDEVFSHPEVDVDDFTYSAVTGEIGSVRYTDDRDRIHWFDPAMKAVQAKIDRTFPKTINRVVSLSRDEKKMVVWTGGADDPGSYYVYDVTKRTMDGLARPYAELDGKAMSAVQSVSYTARDGLSIPAYLTIPRGREAKQLPLIVMPHGGPFVRDEWSYDPWVQFLADRGYAVLQPNYRGSTGYGRAFVSAGEGQWGRKMQDDIDDGVKWLADSGQIAADKVCIMGASYGGYAAMWAAARNPDIYRCAISFAGISDVKAMLSYDGRMMVAKRYYRDWRDRVRGESKFDLDSISPIRSVDRIRIPLLIAHGKDDDNVPVSQSEKLHQAMTKAQIDHEFVVYEKEGHNLEDTDNAADFLERVEAFLTKHNPAG